MQTGEVRAATRPDLHARPQRVASWRHFAGFLLIGAGVVVLGILAQYHSGERGGNAGAESRQLAQHSKAVPIYLTVILMDWALFYYCWAGVHRNGGNLKTLSGELRSSRKNLAVDVGIALPFWILWTGTAYGAHWLLESGYPQGEATQRRWKAYCREARRKSCSGLGHRSRPASVRNCHFEAICNGSFMH